MDLKTCRRDMYFSPYLNIHALYILRSVLFFSIALIRLQELLKDPFIRQRQVVVRQFLPHQEYRKLLKELGRAGIKNIVIDVPTKSVQTVLKHVSIVDFLFY